MNISKNRKNLIEKIDLNKSYEPVEAIKILKENSYVKFEESLEIAINDHGIFCQSLSIGSSTIFDVLTTV